MTESLTTVIFVEDEPDIQEVARLALQDVGGLEVRTCDSGAEALAAAEEAPPDLVLLDVMMPGMDGLATLAALQSNPRTRDIPVIFVSAKVQPGEIESYLQNGVIGVIPKPFDPMTLAEQVRDLWRKAQIDTAT